MILDRDKILKDNSDLDDDTYNKLRSLSDTELCKFLIWNHSSNILFNFSEYLLTRFSTLIILTQFSILIVSIYFKSIGYISSKTQIIFTFAILLCGLISILFSIILKQARLKAFLDLKDLNNYINLFHRTILEEKEDESKK